MLFLSFFSSCDDGNSTSNQIGTEPLNPADSNWIAPDTLDIPENPNGKLIRYGFELINRTAAYFGPSGKIRSSTNGLNCRNCHLNAGTKLYANNFSAVASNYPKFRARSGTKEHLEKRINDCMERSLNGKKLDSTSKEMQALVAYINWVGKDVKKNVTPNGAAVVDLVYMDHAADSAKGRIAYKMNCVECHGRNGQGQKRADGVSYLYPPLWGPHSYTNAAGMYRISRLAGFIKSNMPNLKSTYKNPVLSDEEAWNIAAFISSMPRPEKKFKDDWPDISKKPIDYPFGPYADDFTELQHKFGPFLPIARASKKK